MLIPSKLSRPVLDHTVVRERLLAKLSGAHNFRLAPCRLWKNNAHFNGPQVKRSWLVLLDEGDNQQERFASYLIAAIQQATNGTARSDGAKAPVRQPVLPSLSCLLNWPNGIARCTW
jgi:LuxR family maltose regulon positive regulatory protein